MTTRDGDAGRSALDRGDWAAARLAFEASLQQQGETPEALEGLGLAAWWLDLGALVFDARERAYRISRERGDALGAARMAVWLAWDTAAFRGEQAIANGWLQRARRLLEGRPESPEHAWLALRSGSFALLDDGDAGAGEGFASEAVRIGQALELVDHEMVGRALHGFARVTAGRVAEGLQELDEVNAAVLAGEMRDWVLIGLAGCYMVAACERIRDYERAVQWSDRLQDFGTKRGFRPLVAVCRTQYASVCMWRGAWGEPNELTLAGDELAASRPADSGGVSVRLGERCAGGREARRSGGALRALRAPSARRAGARERDVRSRRFPWRRGPRRAAPPPAAREQPHGARGRPGADGPRLPGAGSHGGRQARGRRARDDRERGPDGTPARARPPCRWTPGCPIAQSGVRPEAPGGRRGPVPGERRAFRDGARAAGARPGDGRARARRRHRQTVCARGSRLSAGLSYAGALLEAWETRRRTVGPKDTVA